MSKSIFKKPNIDKTAIGNILQYGYPESYRNIFNKSSPNASRKQNKFEKPKFTESYLQTN